MDKITKNYLRKKWIHKVDGSNFIPYCSIYNQLSGTWDCDIKLAEESSSASNPQSLICDDGKILSVYNITDERLNTAMRNSANFYKLFKVTL